MENRETVCAVVVTYNRKDLLIECLDALCKQTRPLDAIYIIDNFSNDGTAKLLLENGYIKKLPPENLTEPFEMEIDFDNKLKIYYVRMNENTGGAGGFYEGVKRGYEKGYDWLWLMDDDVEPLHNGLEIMYQYTNISECIHPSKEYLNGERFYWAGYINEANGFSITNNDEFIKFKNWTCVNYGCFEGMLIHNSIVKNIGYPEQKLFFIGDDTIYGYLASKYTNNIYIKDICLVKKIDKRGEKMSRIATYLFARNRLAYVGKEISKNKLNYFITSIYKLLRFEISMLKNTEFVKMLDAFRGYVDGLFNKWGGEKRYLGK